MMAGNDTLALLPTGGGKSLCYQVPAIALGGITIVVSPLIALMKDQVSQLRGRRIAAACITAGMSQREVDSILNNSVYDKIKILYVSPERLQSRSFIGHFRQMPVRLIAVDEAHCISQWGYDFRPPYLKIADIRQYHPDVPVIALTATATREVAEDIQKKLLFRKGRLLRGSFARENLSYCVRKTDDKEGLLLRIAQNAGGSGIVYVRNRRRTIEIAKLLNENNIAAHFYHAGIDMRERDKRQRQWVESHNGVMVATTAFGMGIDKPDVRFVAHLDLPESPEAYFQEAGRAGRDGKRAYAVLAYNDADIERLREGWEKDFPPLNYIKNVYKGICNYYQLPVGAGQDSRYEFKLEEICRAYNFDTYQFFRSLKFLESEGLLTLPEHSELQSRLFLIISKEELYRYQMDNQRAGAIITATLRLYGGLFSDFTTINESAIAKRCGESEAMVCNTFLELHRLQMADYQSKMTKPSIIFTSPRIDIESLHISDTNYKDLKENNWKRRQAMIDFVSNDRDCRSRQLLAYFGEESGKDCGVCDVCLSRRERPSVESLEERIVGLLDEKGMTIKALAQQLPGIDPSLLTQTIRVMLDKGRVKMDEEFKLTVDN